MLDPLGKNTMRGRLRRRRVSQRQAYLGAGPAPAPRSTPASQCNACCLREMTLAEAATDELIALLNAADGIGQQSFAQLLQSAARALVGQRV